MLQKASFLFFRITIGHIRGFHSIHEKNFSYKKYRNNFGIDSPIGSCTPRREQVPQELVNSCFTYMLLLRFALHRG